MKQFELLDVLNIMSFCIGLMNLDENLNQRDKQEILNEFSQKADILLKDIHNHLAEQDEKIDKILEEIKNDNRRSF